MNLEKMKGQVIPIYEMQLKGLKSNSFHFQGQIIKHTKTFSVPLFSFCLHFSHTIKHVYIYLELFFTIAQVIHIQHQSQIDKENIYCSSLEQKLQDQSLCILIKIEAIQLCFPSWTSSDRYWYFFDIGIGFKNMLLIVCRFFPGNYYFP